jgi:hypothetical protein
MTCSEYRLWAAVLARAIFDSKKNVPFWMVDGTKMPKSELARTSAIYWLYKSKKNGVGSLVWICEVLDLSVDFVRDYVRGWDGIRFDSFGDLL